MMLKRLGAFLFIAAFGFATVQPATAQPTDNHLVKIQVEDIVNFEVGDDVELLFDEANGTSALDDMSSDTNLDSDVLASAYGTSDYTLQTNRNGFSLDVEIIATNGEMNELGLAVVAENEEGDFSSAKTLTEVNNNAPSSKSLLSEVDPLDETELSLEYGGVITEDFAENDNGDNLRVRYTITAGNTN